MNHIILGGVVLMAFLLTLLTSVFVIKITILVVAAILVILIAEYIL